MTTADQISAATAGLEIAAATAQAAEAAYRKEAALQIAKLERQREFAFRRVRLVKILEKASNGAASEEEAIVAQREIIREEFGWGPARDTIHAVTLDRLEPLSRAVWVSTRAPQANGTCRVADELESFERWYEAHAGQPIYVQFDRYVPEVPVVDF